MRLQRNAVRIATQATAGANRTETDNSPVQKIDDAEGDAHHKQEFTQAGGNFPWREGRPLGFGKFLSPDKYVRSLG